MRALPFEGSSHTNGNGSTRRYPAVYSEWSKTGPKARSSDSAVTATAGLFLEPVAAEVFSAWHSLLGTHYEPLSTSRAIQ